MYKIVGSPRNRSLRVMWALEELDQAYEMELADSQGERLRAINVTGKAPVLLVDDQPICDSVAIITYLADRHGGLTFPAGSLERAMQDAHTQFVVDEMEGALWTAAKNKFIHPEAKRSDVAATCRFEFDTALDRLERRLGEGPFLMGGTVTIADILAAHCLIWGARMFEWPTPEGRLSEYFARMTGRPAFAAALSKGKQVTEAAA